jgi:carboxypeptidase Q
MRPWLPLLCVACASQVDSPTPPPPPPLPAPSPPIAPWARVHQPAVDRILAVKEGQAAWERLRELTDGIGHRLSGSRALERAVDWAAASLGAEGMVVTLQPVTVPHWVRGEARARILAPTEQPLHLLALGGSVATPPAGLRAEVVVVDSFEALAAKATLVKGKIVLFDVPMTHDEHGPGYGAAVAFRGKGPEEASKLGAVAALVRSVTERSLRSPHTGATRFKDAPPIPAAAVSTEDAALIHRLSDKGPVQVELHLSPRQLPDAQSHNVIADLVGSELPGEIVLLGAHLDSWDVGQGAHDDGAGCVMVMEAQATLRRLKLPLRRTVRVVLYTNEENGLGGGKAYRQAYGDQPHFAALEADTGGFRPIGFSVESEDPKRVAFIADLARLLQPIGATQVQAGHSGADISTLADTKAILMGLDMEPWSYFDYHHSEADTLDKVDPAALQADVAAVAAMAYLLANVDAP